MKFLLPILFWLLAIIHILPSLSGLSSSRMAALYGIDADNNTLLTLLQHRALLFGLVAAACIYAAHTPSVRWPVLIGTVASMAGFIVVAALRGTMSGSLSKIVIVDAVGCIIALGAAALLLKGN
jgi:hypothetical protein